MHRDENPCWTYQYLCFRWTQASQKQSTDLILPSISNLHEEIRRFESVLNQRIEALHDVIARQGPKENQNQRDSQWQDESQMVAMCILRECLRSADTVVSSASTGPDSDPGMEASIMAVDSEFEDFFVRRSNVMLQRFVESGTMHEYGRINSPPEMRSLASVPPFESGPVNYPDSDDDLEAEITTVLLYKARKILLTGAKVQSERNKAERYLNSCLSRISCPNAGGQGKDAENRRLEVQALDLLVSIYCDNAQWSDVPSLLIKKMAVKERFCSKDDNSLVADVLLLARALLANHEYVEAHLHARRALKTFRKLGDAEGFSKSLQLLVCICRSDNKEEEAETWEAVLTELYPSDSTPADNGLSGSSAQALKSETRPVLSGENPNDSKGAGSGQPSSRVNGFSSTELLSLSYNRQLNLVDAVSSARDATRLPTSKAGPAQKRKPKLLPRVRNGWGPMLRLPPSPIREAHEDEESEQQQKPKLIPRGASEREPIIELPPCPEEDRQPPKLSPHGVNEREPVLELPPSPEKGKPVQWDSTRLWLKRKKVPVTTNLRPTLPVESEALPNDEGEARLQEVHIVNANLEQTSTALRNQRTKSVDIFVARSLKQDEDNLAGSALKSPTAEARLFASPPSRMGNPLAITKEDPAATPLQQARSKQAMSRLEAAARTTLYEDQWVRRNRPFLMAMMKFTESGIIPHRYSDSTSDLFSGKSLGSPYIRRGHSYIASTASSEALTPSLKMIHPALRPRRSIETWI